MFWINMSLIVYQYVFPNASTTAAVSVVPNPAVNVSGLGRGQNCTPTKYSRKDRNQFGGQL